MLESRTVEDHEILCPAGAPVGETSAGSACLCRITGNLVTTAENPSSLRAYCWNKLASARAPDKDGNKVEHGYQHCPVWLHNRKKELAQKKNELFVTRAST